MKINSNFKNQKFTLICTFLYYELIYLIKVYIFCKEPNPMSNPFVGPNMLKAMKLLLVIVGKVYAYNLNSISSNFFP